MHDLHVTLEFIHGLENQPSSLAYRMATSDRRSWLLTQVALDVVHHFCRPGKGLLLITSTEKDALSLLANEGKGLDSRRLFLNDKRWKKGDAGVISSRRFTAAVESQYKTGSLDPALNNVF